MPGTFRLNPVISTWSKTPVPALLHVNFEARKEMKKSYRLSFPGRNSRIADPRQRGPHIYFNFKLDSLVLESTELEFISSSYPRGGALKNKSISRSFGQEYVLSPILRLSFF